MKGGKVLDASALIAYFENEEGAQQVEDILREAAIKERNLLISTVNWGEVLYVTEKRYGRARRDEIEHLMEQMHLEVVSTDKELARVAADLKAIRKLPYADCFAAALAKDRKAELVTGDQGFKHVEAEIKIAWI